MKSILRTCWIGAWLLVALSACSESDCSIEGQPTARFSFFDSRTHSQVSLFDSLTVTALGTDSVLLNREKGIDHLSLPLSYTESTTRFVLHYTHTLRDTLTVSHLNRPHFISMDCGISMFHTLEHVAHTTVLIDSVCLTNPDINDHEKENYRIYYTVGE